MTEAKYVEKKKSLEFENRRIQLAAEVAKSKARVKILEAPNEVPDDVVALSNLRPATQINQQKSEEVKGKCQKESEPAFTLRKRERCDTNFGEEGKVHISYDKDKIWMSTDADRVSCNERLYPMSYRNTWDPDGSILLKRETSRNPHLMHCVSFFDCRQLHPEVGMEQFDGNALN